MKRLVGFLLVLGLFIAACGMPSGAVPARNSTGAAPPANVSQDGAGRAAEPAAAPAVAPADSASNQSKSAADAIALGVVGEQSAEAGGAAPGADVDAAPPGETDESQTGTGQTAQQTQRMIIYTTSLTLLVQDIASGVAQVSDVATSVNGFVAGIEQHLQDENPSAIVRLKVPAAQYEAVMNRLRAGGVDARDEIANTQDVTAEFADLEIQIKSLEATYNQYLELMKQAKTVEEILLLQTRIDEVKLQIERAKGQANFLSTQAAMATITVTLRPAQQVLVQEYTVLANQQRGLQSAQAQLLDALKRARTPEEIASLNQQLSDVLLQLQRVNAQLDAVKQKANANSIQLPTEDLALQVVNAQPEVSSEELGNEFVRIQVDIRRKQIEQQNLLEELRQTPAPANEAELQARLQATVLELQALQEQLQEIQERAAQEQITLPEVSSNILSALVGGNSDLEELERQRFWAQITQAWEESLEVYAELSIGVITAIVKLWPFILLGILLVVLFRSGILKRPERGVKVVTPPAPPTPPAVVTD